MSHGRVADRRNDRRRFNFPDRISQPETVNAAPCADWLPELLLRFRGDRKEQVSKAPNRVTLRAVAVNSCIAGCTDSTLFNLQFVSNACRKLALVVLDRVSISRLNFTRKDEKNFEVVARAGSGVQEGSQDLDVKTADVPGVDGVLHVLFVDWANRSGSIRVNFFCRNTISGNERDPQERRCECCAAAELFRGRIIQSGTAVVIAASCRMQDCRLSCLPVRRPIRTKRGISRRTI